MDLIMQVWRKKGEEEDEAAVEREGDIEECNKIVNLLNFIN